MYVADRVKVNEVACLRKVVPLLFKCSNTTTKQYKTTTYICISI